MGVYFCMGAYKQEAVVPNQYGCLPIFMGSLFCMGAYYLEYMVYIKLETLLPCRSKVNRIGRNDRQPFIQDMNIISSSIRCEPTTEPKGRATDLSPF